MLLKEFKDVFAWIYKDLKGIPPKLAQHKIELDTPNSTKTSSKVHIEPLIMLQLSNRTLINY